MKQNSDDPRSNLAEANSLFRTIMAEKNENKQKEAESAYFLKKRWLFLVQIFNNNIFFFCSKIRFL